MDDEQLGSRILVHREDALTRGSDVSALQSHLAGLGYPVRVDGIFGSVTADGVRQFQTHRRLVVDGVFGPLTFQELARVLLLGKGPARPYYLRDQA